MLLTFIEGLEDYMGNIGLSGEFELLFVSVLLIAGIAIILNLLGAPRMITLLSSFLMILLFIVFGWIPQWVGFVLGIAGFGFLFITIKGGGSSSD